jgi:hypothetical protein
MINNSITMAIQCIKLKGHGEQFYGTTANYFNINKNRQGQRFA